MKRRMLIAVALLAVGGCTHTPYRPPVAGAPSASLVLKRGDSALPDDRQGGIFAIDGHPVEPGQQFSIVLPPGHHTIAFLCPGWKYVDGFPGEKRNFQVGQRYELRCATGDIRIELVE